MGMRLPPDVQAALLRLPQVGPSRKANLPAPTTAAKPSAGRPRKYRNNPVVVDGVHFDSKKEAARWAELKAMEAAGEISGLRRQVRIPLVVNGVRVATYVADAVYVRTGKRVVEDVKSPVTRRLPVYRLKKRLLSAIYGIDINEV